jgi:DNA-directed RNA polymerase subunit N (RpoN/RPB10)
MTEMWLSYDRNVAVVCLTCGCHMTEMWLSYDRNVAVVCLTCGCRMTEMWLSYDRNKAIVDMDAAGRENMSSGLWSFSSTSSRPIDRKGLLHLSAFQASSLSKRFIDLLSNTVGNTIVCLFCYKEYNYNTTHVEHQKVDTTRHIQTQHKISVILSTFRNVLHNNNWFYLILSITNLVKPHGIPQCASISHVLDLIELLFNGWPEDGLLEAETCSHH